MNNILINTFTDELEKIAAVLNLKSGQKIQLSEKEMDTVFPKRIKTDTRSRKELVKSIEQKRKKQGRMRAIAAAGGAGTLTGWAALDPFGHKLAKRPKIRKAVGIGTVGAALAGLGGATLGRQARHEKNREKLRLLMRAAKDMNKGKK